MGFVTKGTKNFHVENKLMKVPKKHSIFVVSGRTVTQNSHFDLWAWNDESLVQMDTFERLESKMQKVTQNENDYF